MRSASASVPASGFSHATCLPASSAAIACSACTSFGVAMSTRPISGDLHGRSPVRRRVLPAPRLGEALQLGGVAPHDGVHHRLRIDREELADLEPGVGVRAAHELRADEGHVDGFGHRALTIRRRIGLLVRCLDGAADAEVPTLELRVCLQLGGGRLGLDAARDHHQLPLRHRGRSEQLLLHDEDGGAFGDQVVHGLRRARRRWWERAPRRVRP